MEVILRNDVDKLGQAGEIVKVKDGFGRNFLIPRGHAFIATPGNKRRIEAESRHREEQLQMAKADADRIAGTLNALTLNFTAKSGDGDRLFGSITSGDIAEKLAEAGHKIDKRIVSLGEPIKTVGEHKVPIRLHPDVHTEVTVVVEKE
jgi:large subunit ribosomal protein L9